MKTNENIKTILNKNLFPGVSCPEDFIAINRKCYFISNDRVGWIEARKMCRQKGALLVSIQTQEKRREVRSMVSSTSRRRRSEYWIAGNDIEEEGVWEWARTRSAVPTFGWSEEPFNSPEENCLAWTVESEEEGETTDFWHGSSCCNNLKYICEA